MYVTSVIIGVCVLFDGYGVKWYPLWGMLFGVLLVGTLAADSVRKVLHQDVGGLILSDVVGTNYDDTAPFCDVCLLRGSVHRLKAVKIHQQDGLNGIEMLYQVDGVTIKSPQYVSSWVHLHEEDTKLVLFDPDEHIVALHEKSFEDTRGGAAMATNKGRQIFAGSDGFDVPEDVGDWKVQLPGGYVTVGLFGGKNGHIHNLGLIMEKRVGQGNGNGGMWNMRFPAFAYGRHENRE